MRKPDPSPQGTPRSEHDAERDDELTRAAADLEMLTEAYEASSRTLQSTEATVDALLDDPGWCVLVVDHRLRIQAISRGMADRLGVDHTVVGRRAAQVVPPSWALARHLVRDLPDDGWHEVPLRNGAGCLYARRASAAELGPIFVLRYVAVA
jgi:hypothetical protein